MALDDDVDALFFPKKEVKSRENPGEEEEEEEDDDDDDDDDDDEEN